MNATSTFDVIVLGLGPGGEGLAEELAGAGRSVLGIDQRLVGGECPYYGCIPSKMVLRGAELLAEARRVPGMAGTARVEPDFAPVARRIRAEATDNWDDTVAVERLENAGARFVRGTGRLAGRDGDGLARVEVDGTTYAGRHVVVNTGTDPALPPIDGLADLPRGELVWTNREALETETAPGSLVVLGGGPIGCELAQGFARFGTRVSVVEPGPRLLHPEEPEASQVVAEVFEREGITVRCGATPVRVAAGGDGVQVHLDDGTVLSGAKLLVAAGRRPNLDIGLDTLGLDPAARTLPVDDHMRVHAGAPDGELVAGLYAIGDVTGRGAFTHVSVWQARVLAAHLLGADEPFGGYHALAWATFTDPEVGRVGLTEQQARDAGRSVRTGIAQFASNTRGWIHGPGNDGFVKVVEDADAGTLVGATVVGPNGGEIIAVLTLAVHAAVRVRTLDTMHYVYPTLHRAVLEAVRAIG